MLDEISSHVTTDSQMLPVDLELWVTKFLSLCLVCLTDQVTRLSLSFA